MKKLFVLSTILMMGLLGKNAIAQDGDGPNDNPGGFGFKGGIGLTTISFETDDAEDQRNRMKVGGLIGFSYEKRFGDLFALDIELDLVNRGSKWTSNELLGGNTLVVKNNILAIDVPLSAKIYIGNNFNINAGPYFSTTVAGWNRSYTKTEAGDKIDVQDSKNYFSDDYEDADGDRYLNRFDVGLNAGVEFVTNGGFGVGARFQKGFLDMTNNDYLLGDNKRVTNTGVQIYAVVRL